MGELGWTYERWRGSTFTEFNYAADGYWRNWERNTAWFMREVVYTMIAGNPYIKSEDKPSKDQIIKLSTDKKDKEEKKKEKIITPEELEAIRQRMLKQLK